MAGRLRCHIRGVLSFVAVFIAAFFPAVRFSRVRLANERDGKPCIAGERDDGDDKMENGICPLGERFFTERV